MIIVFCSINKIVGVAETNQSMSSSAAAMEESANKRRKTTDELANNALLNKLNIGFIGSGNMARAIVEGMLLTIG